MMGLVVLGCILLALLLYKILIYPALFSPLSNIPNAHFTSPFSDIWIRWQRYRCSQNQAIHDAHKRLGPVVRLGATELSVNSLDCLRTVYGDGFDRHEWYGQFGNYGEQNMFCMAHRRPHKERKRVLASIYSKSTLYTSPEIRKISQVLLMERLLPTINVAAQEEQPLDALEVSLAISIDFITAYLFGLRNSTNFVQDTCTRKRWLDAHSGSKKQRFLPQVFPEVTSLLARLGINFEDPETTLLANDVQDLCLQLMDKVDLTSHSSPNADSVDESIKWTNPVVYDQLLQHIQPPVDQIPGTQCRESPTQLRLTIASELMDHIFAGTETNGWTLTYIMYELSLHSNLQSSLRSELLALDSPMFYSPTSSKGHDHLAGVDLPTPRALEALPLLDAIILETLRRHPAVPGPQPRTSCAQTILGCYTAIPPGIRVSAQAYSLHRNADVFPEPESWNPMRWLNCDKESREKMMRWFWAFGSGGRMCIGNHFAMLGRFPLLNYSPLLEIHNSQDTPSSLLTYAELKLLVGGIYTNYTTRIVDDEGIEQVDAYTGGPKGNKLILAFQRV